MTIDQGFESLRLGKVDQAQHIFQKEIQSNDQRAMLGLAQCMIARRDLDSAERLVQAVQAQSAMREANLLMAQIQGERGQRDNAVSLITQYLEHPSSNRPLGLAILAEQKIRQGYWKEGTDLFIEALTNDRNSIASIHFQKVMQDILHAVSGRKIRPIEALKFLNKVDYSTPAEKKGPAQQMAGYRQHINAGRAMSAPAPIAPILNVQPPQTTSQPAQAPRLSTPAPRLAARPTPPISQPAQPTPKRAPSYNPTPQQVPDVHAPKLMAWPEKQTLKRPVSKEPAFDRLAKNMESQPKNSFAITMKAERKLNEAIQSTIDPLARPKWPSDREEPIDNIDIIFDTQLSISEMAHERYEKDDFHVTNGSIFSQIHMEKCLESFLRSIPYEVLGFLSFQPNGITQIEMNILDGWLENMLDLPPDPLQMVQHKNQEALAIGTFIGESLARAYAAVWQFTDIPSEAFLYIGKQKIHPMQHALRWLASDSREDFSLRQIQKEADDKLPASRFITAPPDYIDSTVGLTGKALLSRVAELWSFYLFKLARVPFTDFVSDIEELWQSNEMLIFRIHQKWCPNMPPAMMARGKAKRDSYVIAFARKSGEFFLMCSRAHVGQSLPFIVDGLDEESARLILRVLAEYHAPSSIIVAHDKDAQQLTKRFNGHAITGPQIHDHPKGKQLIFWSIEQNTPRRWALQFHEENNSWLFLPVRN